MDGPPPQEEDFSTLPISERLSHKNWKARVSGYEQLIKTFSTTASDTDPAFKPYISNPDLPRKIVTDANAVAQEKGVECIVALVTYAGETAARTREAVVPALVDKCLGSSRAGTRNHAISLALQYVEVENGGAGVAGDLLTGLAAKQPKTVSGCVTALKEIIRLFGTQTTPPPPILKALPKVFSHTDKTVRAEGTTLAHVLYQYLGPAIEPWLNDLKPVQVKELKEAFEALEKEGKGKGSLKPERMTRAQAREAELAVEVDAEEPAAEEEEELDPRAFAEPVDISGKIPPSAQLTSSKWKERKEAMDDFLTILNATPRLKDSSEYGDFVKILASRVQTDANINCVISAAACIEGLAKGLPSFGRYREAVIPPMLERLKERKANVTDAIGVALDAVFICTTLPDVITDVTPALSHKNPQVKEGTLKFLGRCLSSSKVPIATPQIKPLAENLATLLDDGYEGARNEAAVCLGTLMKMVGERPLGAVMDGVADIRKAKVKEVFEKATVKCKAGTGSAAPKPPPAAASGPAPKAVKKAPAPKAAEPDEHPPAAPAPVKKPAAKPPALASKKPPAAAAVKKAAPPPAAASKTSKAAPQAAGALDTFKYKHQPEDAEALAAELIPSSIMTSLGDANWKIRLTALDELTQWVESSVEELDAEVVIRALAKKGWGEKNFQVSAKIYTVFTILAERCPAFGRNCVALCVAHLTEKLGDLKLKKPAGDTLIVFSERTSLQFVLNQAYDPIAKQKAPKVIADAVAWINSALIDFGIGGISLRALIECLKTALQHSNAAVRTSATKALVTVKLFAGSSIKDFVQDLNSQLLSTITSEFDKVEGNPAPEPTRTSADLANVVQASSSAGGTSAANPLDELYPRVEIDGLLKGTTILADAKSDAWKTKKEALEALQAILDQGANKRLKPSMGDIGQVLKARVVDTNKAVQSLALDIVARIATGMGKPFEKQTRFFVLPVATVLSDQKAPIRAAAIQTLTAMATACESLDSMVHGITSAFESTNPLQKGSLLQWLVGWFKEHPPSPHLDLSTWASPIVSCLDDRNADVRKGAQALLPTLITCAGYDYLIQQTHSLKPASRNSAFPLIQEAQKTASTQTPAAVHETAKPTPKAPPSPLPASPSPQMSPIDDNFAKTAPTIKATGVRRRLPLGSAASSKPSSRSETPDIAQPKVPTKLNGGPKQPNTLGARTQPSPQASLPFHGANLDAKKSRLSRDANRWINEGGTTRKDLAELLQSQMENHASKELVALLFSRDHNAINDHIAGLTIMCDFYANADGGDEIVAPVCLACLDLPLKYVSIKAHEPQSNLFSKCLDTLEAIMSFIRSVNYQLSEPEAQCFIPTMVHKLGDAREQTRARVQALIQGLPKVYAYSRVFQILLDNGLKSKVAKTRSGTLEEMAGLLKRTGLGACDPAKAFPAVASMISDKDPQVRKSALNVLTEAYTLAGEKVWGWIGPLSPKDKTQLEERLRRVAGPSNQEHAEPSAVPRAISSVPRAGSPIGIPRRGGLPRPASPSVGGMSRFGRPASPSLHQGTFARPVSPSVGGPSHRAASPQPQHPTSPKSGHIPVPRAGSSIPNPHSPGLPKPRSKLPSRLGRPASLFSQPASTQDPQHRREMSNGSSTIAVSEAAHDHDAEDKRSNSPEDASITVTISSILSSDPVRSVDALKKIQKILSVGPEAGPSFPQYRELAEHTEGLIETITLQMAHVFERPSELLLDENFRLAKHLIQTLNTFCDHALLAESLTVDILTSLLEELTLRLLETDDSPNKKVKDLSRFINMIILRLFATGRRMSIFRSLFALLLQIVKPFPVNGTESTAKEAKVAELVLKCVWKLARNLPQDLEEQKVDPVELFPSVEHFLQSVPPNEWRARATNKVPCGDMPLRTIKVIVQHVVAKYGDEVYDLLSAAFDDPSATIVYPYVYRILNAATKANGDHPATTPEMVAEPQRRSISPTTSSRPLSSHETASSTSQRNSTPSHRSSLSQSRPAQEPDPDAQLNVIIGHISSETTGALHKEGITELYQYLKAYPGKRPKVDKMLESTGAAFKKYINRALASRAAEDHERDAVVADTLSKLEANRPTLLTSTVPAPPAPAPDPAPSAPRAASPPPADSATQQKLSRLHNLFQYNRASVMSSNSAQERPTSPAS